MATLICATFVGAGVLLFSCPKTEETPSNDGARNGSQNGTQQAVEEIEVLAFREHSKGLPVGGTWRGYPSLLDFTGDSRADLVVSNREEDGWNAWVSPTDSSSEWPKRREGLPDDLFYGGQDGADVDDDGDLDLILTSHTQGVKVYLNDGEMTWSDAGHAIKTPSMLLDIVVCNLDGDDQEDLVGIGHFNGGLCLYLGQGGGQFDLLAQSTDLIGEERAFGMQVEVADFDGNGLDDIVAATDKGLKAFFTTMKGDALSFDEYSEGLPVPTIGNSLRGIALHDFNEDGTTDIAWCGLMDTSQPVEERNYIGVFQWIPGEKRWVQFDTGLMNPDAYMDVKACDLNKDGHVDLIAVHTVYGALIYLGDGKGGFTLEGKLDSVFGKSKIDVGDVDGDGWMDIAISLQVQKNNIADGGLRVLLNDPEIWK